MYTTCGLWAYQLTHFLSVDSHCFYGADRRYFPCTTLAVLYSYDDVPSRKHMGLFHFIRSILSSVYAIYGGIWRRHCMDYGEWRVMIHTLDTTLEIYELGICPVRSGVEYKQTTQTTYIHNTSLDRLRTRRAFIKLSTVAQIVFIFVDGRRRKERIENIIDKMLSALSHPTCNSYISEPFESIQLSAMQFELFEMRRLALSSTKSSINEFLSSKIIRSLSVAIEFKHFNSFIRNGLAF